MYCLKTYYRASLRMWQETVTYLAGDFQFKFSGSMNWRNLYSISCLWDIKIQIERHWGGGDTAPGLASSFKALKASLIMQQLLSAELSTAEVCEEAKIFISADIKYLNIVDIQSPFIRTWKSCPSCGCCPGQAGPYCTVRHMCRGPGCCCDHSVSNHTSQSEPEHRPRARYAGNQPRRRWWG